MVRLVANWLLTAICPRLVLALVVVSAVLSGRSAFGQKDDGPPQVGEGCLLYRSPISGRYESVPLLHTDVALDVRGLVAAATVTQQYANATSVPMEAVYVFPCRMMPPSTTCRFALATG
jgi:hypothetical protein